MKSIKDLKRAVERGVNITSLLKQQSGLEINTNEIIEIAYDLQSGSYIEFAETNKSRLSSVASEMQRLASQYISIGDSLLDCGTGELTTLSFFLKGIGAIKSIFAFDISHSRVRVGLEFAARYMTKSHFDSLSVFVAEIGSIPLPDNSIDVVVTSHALEPNHGRERDLISELSRVARKYVILFEPSYEKNSDEGKARMENLGYVRGIPHIIKSLGLKLVSEDLLDSPLNALNPTCCYVIRIEDVAHRLLEDKNVGSDFICLKSGEVLERRADHLWSQEGGYAYPLIDGIPVLRKQHSILKTRGYSDS